jgi:7,8-dihydropterin-6-yl-methyl-4-(beta-D-ribofuranosyl)aminobenzene 5'-phosphate synthase
MRRLSAIVTLAVGLGAIDGAALGAERVTILYDAFGKSSALTTDWGFAALVEAGGKRILFDTGNDAAVLERNLAVAGIDLTSVDSVVISHRHSDHVAGLAHVLRTIPNVPVYVPLESFGVFGGLLPPDFYRTVEALPREMRYFGGMRRSDVRTGSLWPQATFVAVDETTEIAPGVFLLPTVSEVPGTRELREISLAVKTPKGLLLVVGCSHAGVERILETAGKVDSHLHLLLGGLHLVKASDAQSAAIAAALKDRWKVEYVAPGHCTGEPTFAALRTRFGDHYLYAGVGTVLTVP